MNKLIILIASLIVLSPQVMQTLDAKGKKNNRKDYDNKRNDDKKKEKEKSVTKQITGIVSSKNLKYSIIDSNTGEQFFFKPSVAQKIIKYNGKQISISASVLPSRSSIQAILKLTNSAEAKKP
jgi:hypothetical protein